MRHIRDYDSHRAARRGEAAVNEEFIGALFNFAKKMFGKVRGYIRKIKGGKECDAIYKKYLQIINNEISKKANIDLNITATLQAEPNAAKQQAGEQQPGQQQPGQQQSGEQKQNSSASHSWTRSSRVYEYMVEPKLTPEEIEKQNQEAEKAGEEEGENNKKIGLAALKDKKSVIEQIIKIYKNKAIKEMDLVLKNRGGAEKNPKLAQIIDNFKDQFQIDILNSQMKYLNKSGDKAMANKLATELQKRNKELEAKWNLDTVEFAKIEVDGKKLNVGGLYRYNGSKGVKTIKVVKVSPNPGEVIATYTYGDTKDKEQSFKAANIDLKFVPEVNGEYAYWSTTNNAGIKVKVLSKPDKKGMVDVEVGDNKFKVYRGALVGDGKKVDLSGMNPKAEKKEAEGQETKEDKEKAQGA